MRLNCELSAFEEMTADDKKALEDAMKEHREDKAIFWLRIDYSFPCFLRFCLSWATG